jgi:hypothetical protein
MHSVRLRTWSGWRRQWWCWVCSSASGAAPDFVIALHERKPSLAISRGGEEVSETTRTASYSIRDSEPFVKTGDPTEGLTNLRHLLACRKGLSAEGGGLFCDRRMEGASRGISNAAVWEFPASLIPSPRPMAR